MFNYMNIFYTFLMLFYIYNVKYTFSIISSYIWSSSIFMLLFIIDIFIKNKINVNKHILFIYFYFFIFISISILSLYFNFNTFEFDVLKLIFAIIIAICIVPIVLYLKFRNNPLSLLKIISFVGLINSFFILGMFFIPEFKSLYSTILINPFASLYEGIDLEDSFIILRMIGITGFSAYSTAAVQIILASIYVLYVSYKNKSPNVFDFFIILFIILSAIISARTSFILLPFFVLYYFFIFGIKSCFKLLSLLSIFLVGSFIFVQFTLESKLLEFFISWSTEVFEKGTSTGSFNTNLQMFKYGFNDFSILGDFKLTNLEGGYYMYVDIGWYRLIFAFGLLGSITLLLFLLNLLFPFTINKENLILIFIFLTICIIMFKGAIIFDAYPLFTLLVILKLLSSKLSHLRKSYA